MVLNFNNLFGSESKNTKLSDFQDLDHTGHSRTDFYQISLMK